MNGDLVAMAWIIENALTIFMVGIMLSGAVFIFTGEPQIAAIPFSVVVALLLLSALITGDQKSTDKKRAFLAEIVDKCEPIGYREPLAFWESAQVGFMCPPDKEGRKPVETWINMTGQLSKVLAAKGEEDRL